MYCPSTWADLTRTAKKTFTGVPKSEEQRYKLGQSNMGKHNHNGENNPMFGRNHDDKAKEAISKFRKGKSFCFWYTNGTDNIYRLKTLPAPEGYRRGRTLNRNATTGRVI